MTASRTEGTFGSVLSADRITVALQASDLDGAVRELHAMMIVSGVQTGVNAEDLTARLEGLDGIVIRAVGDAVAVVGVVSAGLDGPVAALGVNRLGLEPGSRLPEHVGRIRVVLLVFSPRSISELRRHFVPRAGFRLASERVLPALLQADSADAVMAAPELMDAPIAGQMRVEDVMGPAPYRVFADTPIMEVLELAARRELGAVPVVGDEFEVIGIISQADLIRRLLPVWMSTADADRSEANQTARDVMARSVLCVSEEGSLAEAAVQMMNRGVAQLPVVREGKLVGMLERRTVLRALSQRLEADLQPEDELE